MANIRINALPAETTPIKTDVLAIDGATTRKTTIEAAVISGRPTASQAEAETGTDPIKAMVPLTTKQAIAAQAVLPSLTITAGAGLTGGGTLAANRTLALNSASIASLALADSSVQPAAMTAYAAPIGRAVPLGGATTQVLVKLSNADNDVGWTAAGAGDVTQNGVQTLTNKTLTSPVINGVTGLLTQGMIFGITFSNNVADPTNDLDWTVGGCASIATNPMLMAVPGGTMQLDVAYGTGNGGRLDAAISDGTWHCFAFSDGTTVKVGMSKSLNPTGAPNYPAGFTHYRRIFSIIRKTGAILPFKHIAGIYVYIDAVTDLTAGAGVTRVNALFPMTVPIGFPVRPMVSGSMSVNATGLWSIQVAPAANAASQWLLTSGRSAAQHSQAATIGPHTDNLGQIYAEVTNSGGGSSFNWAIRCHGWVDDRGLYA